MKKVDEDRTGISSLLSLLSENQKEKEIFVGRKKEIEAFNNQCTLISKERINNRYYHVLLYTGGKGIGKSTLLKKLIDSRKDSLNYAFLDFRNFTGTSIDVILNLKKQLQKNCRFSFPITDYASYQIFRKTENETFKTRDLTDILSDGPKASTAVLIAKAIAQNISDLGLDALSILEKNFNINIIQEVLSRFRRKQDRALIKFITGSDAKDLERDIALFFIYDMQKNLESNKKQTAIFLDTCETASVLREDDRTILELFTDSENGLFCRIPGLVWVLSERGESGKKEIEFWEPDMHELKPLISHEIDYFLKEAGIKESQIRKAIINKSHGMPDALEHYRKNYARLSLTERNLLITQPSFLDRKKEANGRESTLLSTLSFFSHGWNETMIEPLTRKDQWNDSIYIAAINSESVYYNQSLEKYSIVEGCPVLPENQWLFSKDEMLEAVASLLDADMQNDFTQSLFIDIVTLLAEYNYIGERLKKAIRRTEGLISSHRLNEAGKLISLLENIKTDERLENEISALRACFLLEKGNPEKALVKCEDIQAEPEETFCRYIKAKCLTENSKYEEAIALDTETLNAIGDKESKEYLQVSINLSTAYFRLEDYEKALQIDTACLEIAKKKYPDSIIYLQLVNATATDYQRMNNYRQALQTEWQCFTESEAILGPDHRNTLTALANIGSYLTESDDFICHEYAQKAAGYMKIGNDSSPKITGIRITRYVLDRKIRIFGLMHPDTLDTLCNLGDQYNTIGEPEKALELHLECRNHRTRILGMNHEDTLLTFLKAKDDYLMLNEYSKALGTLQEYIADISPDNEMKEIVLEILRETEALKNENPAILQT